MTQILEKAAALEPAAGRTGIVVGHTHWDREWYLPFEAFRARLVAMLDGLVDILEQDPAYRSFMLDGQAIMLEDYLEVRPEMEGRVRRLVEAGRLKVGPWYTATDTLLPDPEAIVRNLQLGRWAARRLGAEPLAVGYMPDLFGFSGQIPQILNQFGLESAFAWRGLHPQDGATVCWWYAPDGSRVLTLRLEEGYSEAAVGVVDPERFMAEHLESLLARQDRGLYRHRLFMMGSDHFVAGPRLPWLAGRIAERAGHPVRVGGLDEMIELVRSEGNDWPAVRGEQRDSCLVICPASVAGTRIPLKQANQRIEAALLGVAEPLQALAGLAGAGCDQAQLRWAWRLLVQNHPHDSIPGCSTDEVHREMMTRFARAAMVVKDLAQRGARRLGRALDPATRGELGSLGVVSLTGGRHRLRARLHGPEEGVPPVRLVEPGGREIPFAVTGRGRQYVQYHRLQDAFASHDATEYVQLAAPRTWVDGQRTRPHMLHLPWVEIEFELNAPRAGYRVLRLEKAGRWPKPPAPPLPANSERPEIANQRLRAWFEQDGLWVEDRLNGTRLGPLYFSHTGDRGDEYTACPLPETAVLFAPLAGRASVRPDGLAPRLEAPVRAQVPARLRADRLSRTGRARLDGRMAVRLLDERVEIKLELENRACNFDLRLVARLNQADQASSGAPFGVEARPFEQDHMAEKAAQLQLPDFPVRGWVALQQPERAGWAVAARGLYEAAVARVEGGAEIALTLLRGVDYLSRHDLHTRPEHAGPMIATPDAQCPGRHAWELALLPFGPDQIEALPARVEQFLRPAAVFPVQWSAGTAPAEAELIEGDPELVISALKPAFEGEGAVIHAYNPAGRPLAARANGSRHRLDESPAPDSPEVAPFAIAAWRITG